MSRASSRRVAIESRMPRIICDEMAMRPMRSPSSTAIGASSTGGRSTARPGSASRKPFTQLTSGNSRITCRNASAIPISSTRMMRVLSPGLARNAIQICLLSTTTTSAHRIRNTSIRTRKMRGDESLKGSMSCAMATGQPLAYCWSMFFSENRDSTFHAVGCRTIRHRRGGRKRAGGRLCARPGRKFVDTGGGLAGLPDHAQEVALDRLVAGEDAAGREHGIAAVEIGDEAAGLAHQGDAGRHVPGREAALPIGIETAGRDPGEVERCGAEPAQTGDPLLHRVVLVAVEHDIAAARMRQGTGDHCVGEPLASRHPQPLVVEERALAALGGKKLVADRIVDDAGNDRALALECDRDREMRNAVQEVQGAVERIDDPAMGLVAAFARAAFLAEKAVAGPRALELLAHGLLGAPVGDGYEIGRTLDRDLQVLDLAEVAFEHAAGFVRGLDHHVEEGGAEHGGGGLPAAGRCVKSATRAPP